MGFLLGIPPCLLHPSSPVPVVPVFLPCAYPAPSSFGLFWIVLDVMGLDVKDRLDLFWFRVGLLSVLVLCLSLSSFLWFFIV